MREKTNNGVTLKYPDEIGFAFNACLLVASGEQLTKMRIALRGGDRKELVFLDSFKGKCYGDVREYIQTFFDTLNFGTLNYRQEEKTKIGMSVTFDVTAMLGNGDIATFNFDVFYIWGALKIGGQEVYNGYRTLTWFRGYPFTFGIYAAGKSTLLFSRDGVANRFVSLPERGVWNVPMKDTDNAKSYYTVSDCLGTFASITFDNTFDMTFSYTGGGEKTKKLRIDIVDSCGDGFYLRWINRHGFYCYYLFKVGEEQRKSNTDNLFMRNNLLAYDMTFGYEGYTGRQQQMNREDVVSVCAPLVDSETWDMLFDITTSPCVDLFAGYNDGEPKWVSVTVVAGSYVKSRAVLQDFACNILLPDVNIQKL